MSSRCFFKKQTKPKGKAFIVITVSSCHDREGRPIKKGWSDGSDSEGPRTVQTGMVPCLVSTRACCGDPGQLEAVIIIIMRITFVASTIIFPPECGTGVSEFLWCVLR